MERTHRLRLIVIGGLLVSLDVVCTRFLSFYTPGAVDRISLQFLPNALAGMLLGPLWGAAVCILGDTVGMLINSGGFAFTPLITLACAMRGLIYGLVLYRKKIKLERCITAVAVVTVIVELGLMPVFLSVLYGRAWIAILAGKLITRLLSIPVYGFLLYFVARAMSRAGLPSLFPKSRQL